MPLATQGPQTVAALDALRPRFEWWAPGPYGGSPSPAPAAGASPARPSWGISTAPPYLPPPVFTPLTPALKTANLDTAALLPGALDAFSSRGQPYGLPVAAVPTGLLCNTKAFAEAGVPLPSPGWTLADFTGVCDALRAGIGAGRVASADAVLPPLVGSSRWKNPGGSFGVWYGGLIDPTVWGGFVLGYGGTIVAADGAFDLTNAGAVQGLEQLVALARSYGAPQKDAPQSPGTLFPAAMTFYPYMGTPPRGGLPSSPLRWVPFPALPVRPVVPASLNGILPARLGSNLQVQFNVAHAPPQALEAVVLYARWLYGQPATTPTLRPPVVADPRVQDAYWAAQGGGAPGPLVPWRNYAFIGSGWPATPTVGSQVDLGTNEAGTIVFQALTQAVQAGTPLPGLLAAATRQLNAAAASVRPGAG